MVGGRPTGALRASLGAASTFSDAYALVALVARYFVDSGCSGKEEKEHAGAHGCSEQGQGKEQGKELELEQEQEQSLHRTEGANAAAQEHGPQHGRRQGCARAEAGPEQQQHQNEVADVGGEAEAGRRTASSGTEAADPATSAFGPALPLLTVAATEASEPEHSGAYGPTGRLAAIRLYPVKSCAAQEVHAWPVGPTGLLYDR